MSDCIGKKAAHVKSFFLFLLLMAGLPSLGGCLNDSAIQSGTGYEVPKKEETPDSPLTGKEIMPITSILGEFDRVAGWISQDTILYVTNVKEGSHLFLHQLNSGASKLVFKSDSPVVNAEINPSSKQILIHSAPSTYEAELTVIDYEGEILFEKKIESYELTIQWNKEQDGKVLVSAFNEDWSYKTYIVNINENSMTELSLPQPFVVWKSTDEILYLDWNQDRPTLQAPLKERNLQNEKQRELLSSVHQFDASIEVIMAVSTSESYSDLAEYRFMNRNLEIISTLEVHQLTTYSGWLVPYYDIIDSKGAFLYFRPLNSGEADLYGDEFTLSQFLVEKDKDAELMTGMANEPLSCSADGELCLYGYQFEKLIDIKEKKIYNLVEANSN